MEISGMTLVGLEKVLAEVTADEWEAVSRYRANLLANLGQDKPHHSLHGDGEVLGGQVVSVRLPTLLHALCKVAARHNRVSLNVWMVLAIYQSVLSTYDAGRANPKDGGTAVPLPKRLDAVPVEKILAIGVGDEDLELELLHDYRAVIESQFKSGPRKVIQPDDRELLGKGIITPRLPKLLHRIVRNTAFEQRVSMNNLLVAIVFESIFPIYDEARAAAEKVDGARTATRPASVRAAQTVGA